MVHRNYQHPDTRSAFARGIGSPGRTTAIASLSSATKLLSSRPGQYHPARLIGRTINRDGYHALEEEVKPTHRCSGECSPNSDRCSPPCRVSHRRGHGRKGLERPAYSPSALTELAAPLPPKIAQRRSASSHREAIAAASASPCPLKVLLTLPRSLFFTPGPVGRVLSLKNLSCFFQSSQLPRP